MQAEWSETAVAAAEVDRQAYQAKISVWLAQHSERKRAKTPNTRPEKPKNRPESHLWLLLDSLTRLRDFRQLAQKFQAEMKTRIRALAVEIPA